MSDGEGHHVRPGLLPQSGKPHLQLAAPGEPGRAVVISDLNGKQRGDAADADIEPGSALDQVLRRIEEKHPPRNPR